MDRAGFVISFDGPGIRDGRIDVRELAPALLSLAKLIDAANIAIYGDKSPIKVEAKAVSEGSFEVALEAIRSNWDTLASFLDGSGPQHAKLILEWVGLLGALSGGTTVSLVKLYRFLKGENPTKVSRHDQSVFVVEHDGLTIIVPLEVMRLYQNIAVNKAFLELLSSVEGDNIDKIDFRDERAQKEDVSLSLDKSDRQNFTIQESPPYVVVDDTRRMALSIRSLAFQEGNKWRLFDGQNTITASIDDKSFIDRVDSNLIRFAKGDVLVCEVRTIQSQSRDGLKTEHTVLRVIEHRPAPMQIGLPFDGT